jgi:hypothetical protein
VNIRTPRNKTGWAFDGALSAKAVDKGGGSDFLKNAPGSDSSTSATAASMGAKGLYAEQYARSKGFDYSVVQWIEAHQPLPADFEAFARSGAGR